MLIYLIDPDYPEERIKYMLKDSRAKVLVNTSSMVKGGENLKKYEGKRNLEIVLLDFSTLLPFYPSTLPSLHPHLPTAPVTCLAYIIYTSGSTGKPKGVMINHYSVVNLTLFQAAYFNITRDDRVLLFSPLCFDASVEQVFISLFGGACLYIIDKTTLLDIGKFEIFTASRGITHLHAVPSFLNTLKLRSSYGLKRIVSGGDVCPVSLARRWSKQCTFYNKYGPTETTVTSIELKVKQVDDSLRNRNREPKPGTVRANVAMLVVFWLNVFISSITTTDHKYASVNIHRLNCPGKSGWFYICSLIRSLFDFFVLR